MGRMKEKMMREEEEVREELEGVDDSTLVEAVLDWALEQPNFDTSFLESLQDWLDDNDCLTEGQRQAVEKIVHKYDVDMDNYLM